MIALLAPLALAQDPNLPPISEEIPFGCEPSPLPGTAQLAVVQQSRQTNAQLYSAAVFAERVIFPRMEKRDDREGFPVWATEMAVLNGVSFVPSRESGCEESGYEHINHRVDLFGSSTGLGFSVGPVDIFYAGSLTGHMYARRVASGFVPYGYGLGTALGGPLVTVPMTYMDRSTETSSITGDYMVGASVDVFGQGAARVAWVGSNGLYTNITGSKVRLFAAAALEELSELEYFRGGLERQLIGEGIGYTSTYFRNQELSAVTELEESDTEEPIEAVQSRSFKTGHFAQEGLFGVLDVHFAYALEPDLFVHDVRLGLHTRSYDLGQRVLSEGEGLYDFQDAIGGGLRGMPISIKVGQTRLPALPYWGVPGGEKIAVELDAFMLFPTGDSSGVVIRYAFKVNDPDTLSSFPYAQDALSHYFTIQLF